MLLQQLLKKVQVSLVSPLFFLKLRTILSIFKLVLYFRPFHLAARGPNVALTTSFWPFDHFISGLIGPLLSHVRCQAQTYAHFISKVFTQAVQADGDPTSKIQKGHCLFHILEKIKVTFSLKTRQEIDFSSFLFSFKKKIQDPLTSLVSQPKSCKVLSRQQRYFLCACAEGNTSPQIYKVFL